MKNVKIYTTISNKNKKESWTTDLQICYYQIIHDKIKGKEWGFWNLSMLILTSTGPPSKGLKLTDFLFKRFLEYFLPNRYLAQLNGFHARFSIIT